MRIAFVSPEFVTEEGSFDGGLANYLYRVARSLKENGHDPLIIVASTVNESISYNGLEVSRVAVPAIPDTEKRWLMQSALLNARLESLNEAQAIDLVQYASYTATAFFRSGRIPSVVRISSLQRLWDKMYGKEQSEMLGRLDALELEAFKKADSVYGPSRIIADAVADATGLKPLVIEPPYLPADSERNDVVFRQLLEGKKYLLFFGTIGVLKGCLDIASILEEFLERNPGYHFCFVGKDSMFGTKRMSDYILEKAGREAKHVILIDKLPQAQLIPVIEHADGIVLPSRIDNFPNTCIEAMALGKVVLGTRHTGFDQLIKDQVNGLLCEPDSPASLMAGLENMLSLGEDEKARMEQAARERISELSPDKRVPELLRYYASIIESFSEKGKNGIGDTDALLLELLAKTEEERQLLVSQVAGQKAEITKIYQSRTFRTLSKMGHLLKRTNRKRVK